MKTPENAKPTEPVPTQDVVLLNFGDSSRVVYKPNGKPVQVNVGAVVTTTLSEKSIARVKTRDKTLVILPADIADKATGPFMRNVLNALRDFDSLDYNTALHICLVTMGDSAFETQRPTKTEMRLALARRAKDAAHYIIAGAYETADKLLGEGREIAEVKPAKDGVGVVPSDVVQGDPDTETEDGHDTRYFQRPEGYVQPADSGGSAEGDGDGNAQVVPDHNGQAGADQSASGAAADSGAGHAGEGEGGAGQEAGHSERRQRPVTGKPGRVQRPVKGE